MVISMQTSSADANSPDLPDDFDNLLARIRGGDESACAELFNRYERAVIRAVRARLSNRMRRFLDSIDVAQSVHRSLLIGVRDQRFQFSHPAQLMALAVVLVQRKVARQWRKVKHYPAESLNDSPNLRAENQQKQAEPSGILEADELLTQFLSRLDDLDRRLIQLKLDGNSSAEIATTLGLDSAFIRMRWSRLRSHLRGSGLIDMA